MANKDQPLRVDLTGGLLTVSIGASALCAAVKTGPAFRSENGPAGVEIVDEDAFVRAVVGALGLVSKDGRTAGVEMFDHAAFHVACCDPAGLRITGEA